MLWLWPPADCNRQVSDGLAASYSFHIGVGGYGYSIGYGSQALITTENKGPVSLQTNKLWRQSDFPHQQMLLVRAQGPWSLQGN